MKIVVTGCNGYIGSILCAMLKQSQYKDAELIGIDRNNGPGIEYCDYFIRQDFRTVYYAIGSADVVFHLAAEANVPDSVLNPGKYFEVNTAGTLHVIQQMKKGSRLINISSAAVFPLPGEFVPPNNYGKSKLMAEQIIEAIAPTKEITVSTFRPFNVVGTYSNLGQNPESSHILNSLCRAYFGKQPFKMYGDCERDYIDVKNVVSALISAVNPYMKFTMPVCYNLGVGRPVCTSSIINLFEHVIDDEIIINKFPMRNGDPTVLVAPSIHAGQSYTEISLLQSITDHVNYYKKVKNIE